MNVMRVLVCGGRDFHDIELVNVVLAELDKSIGITTIIHGKAKGADTLGGVWGEANQKEILVFPADWKKHGKRAGPIRNQQMLDEGHPDLVVAFPGGNGTEHMKKISRRSNVDVIGVSGTARKPILKDFF
jgi:hypothetical protein